MGMEVGRTAEEDMEATKEVELVAHGEGGGAVVAVAKPASIVKLILACTVYGGVQYGWALQLSPLTPYVQTLGLPHSLSSIMWLCGPIAGFLVQPTVGYWSDRCYSRFGRRRPFICTGCLLICASVIVIGFSTDIGSALGDTKEHCSTYNGRRSKAVVVYVAGFWLLDLSNNVVLCPTRALMADLAGPEKVTAANAIFCAWIALGNLIGYASGANGAWHRWLPFLNTRSCCAACANLKGAFLVAVLLLLFCLLVTLVFAKEIPLEHKSGADEKHREDEAKSRFVDVFMEIFRALKHLPSGMPSILLVTALTWLSWFPFFLYNTDWMGREVYHGKPDGTSVEKDAYDRGVRKGAFGLLLNSIVLGISCLTIEPLCRRLTSRVVWVLSNFFFFAAMAAIAIVSRWSIGSTDARVRTVAVSVVAALGFPLAVLYSVPSAVTAQLAARGGRGQGWCSGVLNISVVIPQVIIALSAGPLDALFGGGNIPAFALSAAFAFVSGLVGLLLLPKLSSSSFKSLGLSGVH